MLFGFHYSRTECGLEQLSEIDLLCFFSLFQFICKCACFGLLWQCCPLVLDVWLSLKMAQTSVKFSTRCTMFYSDSVIVGCRLESKLTGWILSSFIPLKTSVVSWFGSMPCLKWPSHLRVQSVLSTMFLSVTSSFHSGDVENGFSVLYSDTAKCVCREKSEEIALLLRPLW